MLSSDEKFLSLARIWSHLLSRCFFIASRKYRGIDSSPHGPVHSPLPHGFLHAIKRNTPSVLPCSFFCPGLFKHKSQKKQYSNSGFYGAWVEYGGEVKFGGKGFGKRSQPFMRPAFEETKVEMMNNALKDAETVVAKQIKRHERKLQKHGLFGY